jgi:dihydroflavonol-4-reductase
VNTILNNRRISITGGSGHLGNCLVDMLLENEFLVRTLFYRTKPRVDHVNLDVIKGDIMNKDSIENLIIDSSILIHAASIISIGDEKKEDVFRINVVATEGIIDSCIEKKCTLIYISSSAAVLETKEDEIFNESRPYKSKSDFVYPWTKALAEQKILVAVQNKKLKAFIIRPTAIVGPPDWKPSHFGKVIFDLASRKLKTITSGGYNIIDVRDLSKTIINSINKGKKGEVYLVGGPYVRLKDIAKLLNPKSRTICIPIQFLIFILPIINLYDKLFPLKWPITKESLITLKKAPIQMDMTKAIKNLDHSFRPVESTILDLVNWYSKQN